MTTTHRQLLPPQVRAIRAALANGDDYRTIARAHGTIALVIHNIARGQAYKGVGIDPTPRIDPKRERALQNVIHWNNTRRFKAWPHFIRPLAEAQKLSDLLWEEKHPDESEAAA